MFEEEIDVEEDQISEEEWAALMARAQQQVPPAVDHEKRGKQPPVPDHPARYLNRVQLASITKLETFGWELFFIRRSDPDETLTVMYLPSSGETAVIEKDGTVNRSHGVITRPG